MKIKYSKLSKNKQYQLKKLFLANISARKDAEIVKINRNSYSLFFRKIRKIIANQMSKDKDKLSDEVEVDEMYYSKKKGSIGRNTKGKIVLMEIKKEKGDNYKKS